MLAQQAAPTAARGGGKAAKGGKGGGKGGRQGWWPWRTRPALRRRPQRPIYSVRAGGATAAEVRPPATSHGVERRRDGPESRHQVCHDRGREARGDGCARPALRRRPQRPILGQSRRSDGGGVAAAGDLPLDHAADPSTSTRGLPSRRRRRRAAHPEPAGAAWAGAGAGGRAGTPPAEATMPLAALQAARGAPLAGLPDAPEGREGREAGSVTRGHGRCGPRRARARGSP